MKSPFQTITILDNDRIALASGNQLVIIKGDQVVVNSLENVSMEQQDLPSDKIRQVAFHSQSNRLALSSDDKLLQIWDLNEFKKLATFKTVKRTTVIEFPNKDTLLIGDKFGDVYRYDLSQTNPKPRLLLGHVSILTDMTFSPNKEYLITSDRDEKIRVSCYPNTFSIHQFILGHTEFVSKLFAIPGTDLVLSGGGDSFLLSSNYKTGEINQKLQLDQVSIV